VTIVEVVTIGAWALVLRTVLFVYSLVGALRDERRDGGAPSREISWESSTEGPNLRRPQRRHLLLSVVLACLTVTATGAASAGALHAVWNGPQPSPRPVPTPAPTESHTPSTTQLIANQFRPYPTHTGMELVPMLGFNSISGQWTETTQSLFGMDRRALMSTTIGCSKTRDVKRIVSFRRGIAFDGMLRYIHFSAVFDAEEDSPDVIGYVLTESKGIVYEFRMKRSMLIQESVSVDEKSYAEVVFFPDPEDPRCATKKVTLTVFGEQLEVTR
jgi:hypothetical protein